MKDNNIMNVPLWQLTVSDFIEVQRMALNEQVKNVEQQATTTMQRHYVYGLRGIKELFGVSHATAQKLKDGVLAPSVRQLGRKIVVDADMAMELFNQNRRA